MKKVLLFLALVGNLSATKYYVSTTGNNSNNCTTLGTPCLTVAGVFGKTPVAGDEIEIAAGSYGALSISGKSYASDVYIHAATGASVTMSGGLTINATSSHLRVENITFTTGGFDIEDSTFLTMRNLDFSGCGGGCTTSSFLSNVQNLTAQNIKIHDVDPGDGLQIWPSASGHNTNISFDGLYIYNLTRSNDPSYHQDGVQLIDCNVCTFNRVRMFNISTQGFYMKNDISPGTINNVNITNGWFGTIFDGAYTMMFDTGGTNVNVLNNSIASSSVFVRPGAYTNFNFSGNIWLDVLDDFTCNQVVGNVTTFKYNVIENSICSGSDSTNIKSTAAETYVVNPHGSPFSAWDMHLSAAATTGVKTNVTTGCPSADMDNVLRPTPCAAGANEYVVVSQDPQTYTVDDFTCTTLSNVTRANPAVATCATGTFHGYDNKHATAVSLISIPAAGDTVTYAGITYTFRDSLSGCSAYDVKRYTSAETGGDVGIAQSKTTGGLVAAIMAGDSLGYGNPTVYNGTKTYVDPNYSAYYCPSTPRNPYINAYSMYSMGTAFGVNSSRHIMVVARQNGTSGRYTISKTGSIIKHFIAYYATEPASLQTTNMEISWWLWIDGATGSNSDWGQFSAITGIPPSNAKLAVYVANNQFKFPTINSSGFATAWTASQGNWKLYKAAFAVNGNNAWKAYQQDFTDASGVPMITEGGMTVNIPDCSVSTVAENCGLTFMSADNQKGYGNTHNIAAGNSIVCTSGSCVVTWGAGTSWSSSGSFYASPAINTRVWVRGFQKYYLNQAVTNVTNNGSGLIRITTGTAHNYVAGDTANISGVTGVTGANGTFTATVINSTTLDLQGTTFSGSYTGGGTITSNPSGYAARPALSLWALGGLAVYKTTAINGTTSLTFSAPNIPDGTYTGTCTSPAGACGLSHVTQSFLVTTQLGFMYLNQYGANGAFYNNTDTGIWPTGKIYFNAKQSMPDEQTPNTFTYITQYDGGSNIKRPAGHSDNGMHQGTYPQANAEESGMESLQMGHKYDKSMITEYNHRPVWHQFTGPTVSVSSGVKEYMQDINQCAQYWPEAATSASGYNGIKSCFDRPDRSYMANLSFMYLSYPYAHIRQNDDPEPNLGYANGTMTLIKHMMSRDDRQPFAWVKNMAGAWAPQRYVDDGRANDGPPTMNNGYDITWYSMPYDPPPSYLVRWTNSGTSVYTLGWSALSSGGNCGNTIGDACTVLDSAFGYQNAVWQSPDMIEQNDFRAAIKPIMGLIGASSDGESNIIQVKLEYNENAFQIGDSVTVSGAGGNRDGSKTISGYIRRQTFFHLLPDQNTATTAWTTPGNLSSIICSTGTCTASFTQPHGLTKGMLIAVMYTNNPTVGGSFLYYSDMKKYRIATIPNSTSFTFSVPGVTGTMSDLVANAPMMIHVFPGFILNGTNSGGDWSGSGTVLSTMENRGFAEFHMMKLGTPNVQLTTSTTSLNFTATAGGSNPSNQTFTASLIGGAGTISQSESTSWFSVSPSSGTAPQTFTVSVNITGLAAGSYSGPITVSSTDATTGSPSTVTINLTVTAEPTNPLSVAPTSLNFSSTQGATTPPPSQNVTSSCPSGCGIINTSTDQDWCSTNQAGNVTTVNVDPTGLTPGDFTCTLHLEASDATGVTSQDVPIGFHIDPPATVSSGTRISGSARLSQGRKEVVLTTSDDIQGAVTANPAGTTFRLAGGTYRNISITPKSNDSFIGSTGTIFNGSIVYTPTLDVPSGLYKMTGVTQEGQQNGQCDGTHPRCMYPEDLYIDGQPQLHVASKAAVNATGKWFLDYTANEAWMFDNPAGHVIEISSTRNAFAGTSINVLISNITVEKYAVPAQFGAIGDGTNGIVSGSGWTVDNCEVRYNHGIGINSGDNWVVSNNYVHHNGELGLAGHGNNGRVSGNENAFNQILGFDIAWEGGGTKFVNTNGYQFLNNNSHDNNGVGWWTDINNINCIYDGNTFTNNSAGGISHEISYKCIIRNNTFRNNGNTGSCSWWWNGSIQIQNSQDVEVYNNIIKAPNNTCAAVTMVQQDRSGEDPNYITKNNYVHDNDITYIGTPQQGSGGVEDYNCTGTCSIFSVTNNNRWDNNAYHITNQSFASMFAWANSARTYTSWKSFGLDAHSTIDSTIVP